MSQTRSDRPVTYSPSRFQLAEAEPIAAAIVEALAPFCVRIVVAGSIRRRAATVGDVELVAIPATRQQAPPLFPDLAPLAAPVDCLDEHLDALLAAGVVRKRAAASGRTAWGPFDKRMLWRYGSGRHEWIALDLFGATVETWGAKLCLRTGPWELSRRLVTHRGGRRDGTLHGDLLFRNGGLWRFDASARKHFVPTPDEMRLFQELGLPYVPPEDRTPTTFRNLRSDGEP